MTTSQAIVREIRESCRLMSEQCGHDIVAFIEHMKSFNAKYAAQVERYRKEHQDSPTEPLRAE